MIEDLLFKRRVVFTAERDSFDPGVASDETYDVAVADECSALYDHDVTSFLTEHTAPESVGKRMARDDCTCYLARHRATAEPVGFYWSVAPTVERVWHDSFPVDPGEALVFNAYVDPDHRRQGVYRLLQTASHRHLFESEGLDTVYTVVEARNTPSIEANEAFGLEPSRRNYLVKALGVNVLSILREDSATETHLVMDKPTL